MLSIVLWHFVKRKTLYVIRTSIKLIALPMSFVCIEMIADSFANWSIWKVEMKWMFVIFFVWQEIVKVWSNFQKEMKKLYSHFNGRKCSHFVRYIKASDVEITVIGIVIAPAVRLTFWFLWTVFYFKKRFISISPPLTRVLR